MIECVYIYGEPDSERKNCNDCLYCKAAVSWWCTNEDAKEYRGTNLPGICNCKFWSPIKKYYQLSFWKRFFGNILNNDFIILDLRDKEEDHDPHY